jgi:hypothetical protein
MSHDVPRADVPYTLEIDGVSRSGRTRQDGRVEEWLPPAARVGKLIVGTGAASQVIDLRFGELDPVSTERGVRARLVNLAFLRSDDAPEADVTAAVRLFQRHAGLDANGELDDRTRELLLEAHKS